MPFEVVGSNLADHLRPGSVRRGLERVGIDWEALNPLQPPLGKGLTRQGLK